jgi:hypothetical protein
MEVLYSYMVTIWMLVACLFGLLLIGAFIKATIDLIRRK